MNEGGVTGRKAYNWGMAGNGSVHSSWDLWELRGSGMNREDGD